ncbi:hypothetical protein GCM10011360_34180 [Primorskyibacter flagellatus]|uniref:GlsB/YeaQ/YmgE family stress response membrane protein n=1 Tax=Primorskyibacter flagellatus TaxID=1387277 RepID=A0A917ADN5_9RHOB|nr:GlsB/YeaQ/YmgE family stress response membrane protein [Primorskyibacter flagellatus]GGE44102.1 hypothetical protein GCM10011360_34180 [Primorskyibacter flagellatus]
MGVIWLLIVGAAAGFFATRIMRVEASVPVTVAIGMGGAVIGGLIVRALLSVMGLFAGLVGAVLGALLLIWLWQTYGPK